MLKGKDTYTRNEQEKQYLTYVAVRKAGLAVLPWHHLNFHPNDTRFGEKETFCPELLRNETTLNE